MFVMEFSNNLNCDENDIRCSNKSIHLFVLCYNLCVQWMWNYKSKPPNS